MRTRIVVFPGSNCDHDAMHAMKDVLKNADTEFIWHKEESIGKKVDLVILPGGFAYGDYLRTGAIARFSNIMKDVVRFANDGGTVIGICNGFQVLCECGLLPGVLIGNQALKFRCTWVHLRAENADTRFTNALLPGEILKIPIAHGEGLYMADSDVISELEANNQVVFRYTTASGEEASEANPNGSINNIAGIINKEGNVFGMMPHPERACEAILGSTDGRKIFSSIIRHFEFATSRELAIS